MALIKCPDCTHDVSDQAELCRHCGRPIKNAITVRVDKDEIELDLFDPYEAQRMRTQIIKNESSLTQFRTEAKAALKKKKQREDRMSLIRNIVLILIVGIAAYIYKRLG